MISLKCIKLKADIRRIRLDFKDVIDYIPNGNIEFIQDTIHDYPGDTFDSPRSSKDVN